MLFLLSSSEWKKNRTTSLVKLKSKEKDVKYEYRLWKQSGGAISTDKRHQTRRKKRENYRVKRRALQKKKRTQSQHKQSKY